jgi:drug/metabolite transporter (DMT)-like permease
MATPMLARLTHHVAQSDRLRGLLLLLAGTAVVSLMDALVKLLSASQGTLQIVWGRYVTQAILLFLVIEPRRSMLRLRTARLRLHLFRVATLLSANVIFFAALRTMTLADANAIFFSSPLLITLFAAIILGEAVGIRRWIAVGTGFAGVLLVMQPGFGTLGWTTLLPFLAAMSSALYHVTTPVLARSEDPINTLYFLALLASIGLSLVVPFYWTPLTWAGLAALLVIGTLGTAGHFLLIRAFQTVPASTLSPFLYVYLIWATILGWLIFGDVPGITTVAGALIIFGSGVYVYRHSVIPAIGDPHNE